MTKSTFTPFRIAQSDVELQAYRGGAAGGPLLVAVHGIQDQATALDRCLSPLLERFDVVSFDLRGHGDSGQPGTYTLLHYLADLDAVLDTVAGERQVVLLGHSLGGQIVSQYAALEPKRASAVISIEGLGPPGPPFSKEHQLRRARQALRTLRKPPHRRPAGSLEEAVAHFRKTHPRLAAAEAERLTQRGTVESEGILYWKWDPRVLSSLMTVDRSIVERRWGWISSPLLLITAELAGEFWQVRREIAGATQDDEELARRIALFRGTTPRHVEIRGAGHMTHYDRPDELGATVAHFLDDSLPAGSGETR
ncbi:MAG: alpha/beta hydrolase [Acidobacteriota bacterium]